MNVIEIFSGRMFCYLSFVGIPFVGYRSKEHMSKKKRIKWSTLQNKQANKGVSEFNEIDLFCLLKMTINLLLFEK